MPKALQLQNMEKFKGGSTIWCKLNVHVELTYRVIHFLNCSILLECDAMFRLVAIKSKADSSHFHF
jgi:hypothetical protein